MSTTITTADRLSDVLFARFKQTPDEVFLVEEEHRWRYRDLAERVERLAGALRAEGIRPGDKVALMFFNQKEYFLGFFAILLLDAVVVPINLQMGADDLAFIMQDAGVKLVLTNTQFAPMLAPLGLPLWVSAPAATEVAAGWTHLETKMAQGEVVEPGAGGRTAQDMGILMYTSGTTGRPKGVMLSEENLLKNLEGIHPVLGFTAQDRVLMALPLFHAFGLIIGLYILQLGARLVLVPKFAPKKMIQFIAQEEVTVLPLVPTMFSLILEAVNKVGIEPFKSLRACVSGGAGLPGELLKRIESTLNVVVLEGYGLTETSPVLAVNNPKRGSIPKSVGKAIPNVSLKLVADNGKEIPWQEGEVSAEGEIWAKGPNVMLGYYGLPEATREVLDEEGWFKTGDLGHFDEEKNLFISGGRKKDLIIKAGENISPLKIEEVLYQHSAILEASVIGVPDPKIGEEIVACIQFKPEHSATAQELKKFCRERLPSFMVPEIFRVYDELPRTQTGKILKKILREQNPTLSACLEASAGPSPA